MNRFNPHDRFFSSLNQLQNRLAFEEQKHQQAITIVESSPLFLTNPKSQQFDSNSSNSSGLPLDFLSNSPITTQHHQEQDPIAQNDEDGIETLMGLLGLSIPSRESEKDGTFTSSACSCDCSGGGFYKRVVGVKGPRCEKESKRLDAWIDLYYEQKREPARLAHLMISKAVALSRDGDGFDGVEFLETVDEFLEHDPLPQMKGK